MVVIENINTIIKKHLTEKNIDVKSINISDITNSIVSHIKENKGYTDKTTFFSRKQFIEQIKSEFKQFSENDNYSYDKILLLITNFIDNISLKNEELFLIEVVKVKAKLSKIERLFFDNCVSKIETK